VSFLKRETIVRAQKYFTFPFYLLAKLFLRPKVNGLENLEYLVKMKKDTGLGVIIASNHINALDPFFIFALMPLRLRSQLVPITFLGKMQLFGSPLKNLLMSMFGVIPVEPGRKLNVRNAIKIIKNGGVIFLFPEGHVSRDGSYGEGARSISVFSHCLDSFILEPVRICGITGWKKDWLKILFWRRRLQVNFGHPRVIERNMEVDIMRIIKYFGTPLERWQ
jgi:1-acyl-sn-glycerol-3-phosphate acyltransferase